MLVEQMFPKARERIATIGAGASVTDPAEVTSRLHADLVALCNEAGSMVGVITKIDIVSQIGRCGAGGCSASVDTIMTREVFSCRANELLQDVWTTIEDGGLHASRCSETTARTGILYSSDLLQSLLGKVEDEETLLRDYAVNVGYR